MFCKNCGAQIKDGAKFCPKCGTPAGNTNPKAAGRTQTAKKPPYLAIGLVAAVAVVAVIILFFVGRLIFGKGYEKPIKTLAKGIGHFEDTSIWNGNVCLAAHNRGANSYFGQIHTLDIGDKITLTTKLGTRTYEVVSVSKVSETDRSGLAASNGNMITLYTCVMNQNAYRWCVQAVEVG